MEDKKKVKHEEYSSDEDITQVKDVPDQDEPVIHVEYKLDEKAQDEIVNKFMKPDDKNRHVCLAMLHSGVQEKGLKERYESLRALGKVLFTKTVQDVVDALKHANCVMHIPQSRDLKKRYILYFRPNQYICTNVKDVREKNETAILTCIFVIMWVLSKNPEVRENSFTLLCDMTNWGIKKNMSKTAAKKVANFMKLSSPLQWKQQVMVNTSGTFGVVLKWLVKIMPVQVRKQFDLRPQTSLGEVIPKELIPTELGGEATWNNDKFVETYKKDIQELVEELHK